MRFPASSSMSTIVIIFLSPQRRDWQVHDGLVRMACLAEPIRDGAMSHKSPALDSVERITRSILVLRGRKVLLDADLAGLYEVSTKRFNEQVRRNLERFPPDFMFQLTAEEHLTGLPKHCDARFRPNAR